MPLYKPSELKALLNKLGKKPNKRASQNFLINQHVLKQMLQAADVQGNDHILEIGPGPGALTETLLATGSKVTAIERDYDFANYLKSWPETHLTVIESDILKCPLDHYFSASESNKVVANLPYHITTPILEKLLSYEGLFSTMTLMLQKEVALRMISQPGTKDYSSLTVFLATQAEVTYDFTVSKHCYYPIPNVDSSVVTLKLRKTPLVPLKNKDFFRWIQMIFQKRRKMLRSSLRTDTMTKEMIESSLADLNLATTTRAETLSIDTLIKLFKKFH